MNVKRFLLFTHLVILLLLFSTLFNAWISPSLLEPLNFLSLGFPYLMILHLLFSLLWMIKYRKIGVLFLLSTVLFYNPIRRWFNFLPNNLQTNHYNNEIKVLTFNIKYGDFGLEKVRKYIIDQDSDIILVQEKDIEKKISEGLVKYPSVILKTKHKIIRQQELISEDFRGNSFYADVEIRGKIIRVVNVYLEPFRLNKSMFKFNDIKKVNENFTSLLNHMIPTFKAHESQIKVIRKVIDSSPYPVILAGDFNSVPNSYEYYTLGKGLKDTFLEAGKGNASSFHDYKIPLRIDYIFSSESLKPVSCKVDQSVKLSDHYPVIAEFQIN